MLFRSRAALFGVLWGWLPCGMVYAALLLAASAGGAVEGASVMLAFGAGTLPALLSAGVVASRLRPHLNTRGWRWAAGMALTAASLVAFTHALHPVAAARFLCAP